MQRRQQNILEDCMLHDWGGPCQWVGCTDLSPANKIQVQCTQSICMAGSRLYVCCKTQRSIFVLTACNACTEPARI